MTERSHRCGAEACVPRRTDVSSRQSLYRIELVVTRHDHDPRAQHVQHFDCPTLRRQDIGKATVHGRTFVHAAAAQDCALLAHRFVM